MSTKVTIWRSVRKEDYPDGTVIDNKPAKGVLYPDFEPRLITGGKNKGKYRDPDVSTKDGFVMTGGGTSLFDKNDVFGTSYWHSFEIPEGTEVPDSLLIVGPDYRKSFDANHYQIEVRTGMITIDAYKGALDNFARSAVARKCALANK